MQNWANTLFKPDSFRVTGLLKQLCPFDLFWNISVPLWLNKRKQWQLSFSGLQVISQHKTNSECHGWEVDPLNI